MKDKIKRGHTGNYNAFSRAKLIELIKELVKTRNRRTYKVIRYREKKITYPEHFRRIKGIVKVNAKVATICDRLNKEYNSKMYNGTVVSVLIMCKDEDAFRAGIIRRRCMIRKETVKRAFLLLIRDGYMEKVSRYYYRLTLDGKELAKKAWAYLTPGMNKGATNGERGRPRKNQE